MKNWAQAQTQKARELWGQCKRNFVHNNFDPLDWGMEPKEIIYEEWIEKLEEAGISTDDLEPDGCDFDPWDTLGSDDSDRVKYAIKWQGSCPTCQVQESKEAIQWRAEFYQAHKKRLSDKGMSPLQESTFSNQYFAESTVEKYTYGAPGMIDHKCETCLTEWTLSYVISDVEITRESTP